MKTDSSVNKEYNLCSDTVIINYPATIYILYYGGKYFKGVARLHNGDIYNEKLGIKIAKLKALRKAFVWERKQHDLNHKYISEELDMDLHRIEKKLNKLLVRSDV